MTTTVGFLGFGEVASRFSEALLAGGARVLAYDVLMDQPGGAETLAARARGATPGLAPLAQLLAQAEIVLSTVTTDVALKAAERCLPGLREGQVYVDLNATAPSVKQDIGALISKGKADFVEGAILSAIGVAGAKAQVLVCGRRADEIATLMTSLGLNFSPYGERIGKASSFKMLRSVFSKGIEALLVEALLAARHAGVEEDLWREIVATLDGASFNDVGGNWVRTHATAHARRYHEMQQVAAVLRELGVEAPMTAATVQFFERSTRLRLKDDFAQAAAKPEEVIAALDARLAASLSSRQDS